jgi:hypothetical protein
MSTVFNPMPLTQEAIDTVFAEAGHQLDYVLGLYRLAYPTIWGKVRSVVGWPKVSKITSEYIYGKAIEFDKKHHPKVFAGGAWLNSGFSTPTDEGIKDWTVIPADVVMA